MTGVHRDYVRIVGKNGSKVLVIIYPE